MSLSRSSIALMILTMLGGNLLASTTFSITTKDSIYSNVMYESLSDSLLIVSATEGGIDVDGRYNSNRTVSEIPLEDIGKIIIRQPGDFHEFGFHSAQKSLFRSIVGGTVGGYSGILIGGGIGLVVGTFMGVEGEMMQGPVFLGIGLGVPTMAVIGLLYFYDHRLGFGARTYDFSMLTLEQKHQELQMLFLKE